jgi:hypothetical protein
MGLLLDETVKVIGIDVSPLQLFVALIGAVVLVLAINRIMKLRARKVLFTLNNLETAHALDSFLESAVRDQPVVEFAQRAFRSLSGELIFIDARLEKSQSTDIPVYDLREWNTTPYKNLPHLIDVTPQGIAVKFDHPGIWYEMVFTSRRGYGTIPVRRYLLGAVCNRVEELLAIQQRLKNHRAL